MWSTLSLRCYVTVALSGVQFSQLADNFSQCLLVWKFMESAVSMRIGNATGCWPVSSAVRGCPVLSPAPAGTFSSYVQLHLQMHHVDTYWVSIASHQLGSPSVRERTPKVGGGFSTHRKISRPVARHIHNWCDIFHALVARAGVGFRQWTRSAQARAPPCYHISNNNLGACRATCYECVLCG